MSADRIWRGMFVIVPTPFNDDLSLDLEGLRRTVRFCIDSGAHGLVTPANASEAPYLTDCERQQVVSTVIDETSRKIPVVIGVTSSCGVIARGLAREAEAAGADALIAMSPQVQRASEPEIKAYYAAIAEASDLPLFLQNYGRPGGTPMSARLMAELVRSLPSVRYVKEETEASGPVMSAVIEAAGPRLLGSWAEKPAATCSTNTVAASAARCRPARSSMSMRRCGERWKQATCRRPATYTAGLLPLLTFEMAYGPAVYKEVLRRCGVIRSAAFRQTGGRQLDPLAMEELTQILDDLGPLLGRRYGGCRRAGRLRTTLNIRRVA
jgi:dihydrodipicolinate synthase/N-acetylneuraminate lyase